jgi:hypothetical protein
MRRVRRLLLSAPSEGLRRRGELLLEDALRTASLPGADDARLWLVRSLRLGRIDPRGSPALLARSIEERLRQEGLQACPGDDPAAEAAPVVVFASGLEAACALGVRVGRGEPVRGWFWPLAVPAYRPGAAPAETLRALLRASLDLPGGAAASAAWLERLVEAGAVEPLLASLSATEAEGLLRLGGWEPRPGSALPSAVAATPGRVVPLAPPRPPTPWAPAWGGVLERWLPHWGASDPRGLWLVAMALTARHPARIGAAALLAEARALQAGLEADRLSHTPATAPGQGPRSEQPTAPAAAASPASAHPGPGHSPSATAAGPGDRSLAEPQATAAAMAEGPDPAATAVRSASGGLAPEPSRCAGFAFLVVLSQRQGLEAWLERYPALADQDWPRQLLRQLADGLAVPAADPLRRHLALDGPAPAQPPELSPLADPAVLAALSRQWRRRLRRWCQGPGRPRLEELVWRPGLVVAGRTHLEVWFEPCQAEIRLRRHGLDLDPGWVPWLGRVVSFHYDRRGPGDGGI